MNRTSTSSVPAFSASRARRAPARRIATAAALALLAASFLAPAARAGDSTVVLGVPRPATMRVTTNATKNAWLATNDAFAAEAFFTAYAATSRLDEANRPVDLLASSETGFPLQRTIPEYYLGDKIEPPDNVDWVATYAVYTNSAYASDFIFDTSGKRLFVCEGGTLPFTWVLADGTRQEMNYVISPACSGRPRRIYWTDSPWNAPAIDLSGKFVKFFGDPEILTPVYGTVTNISGGIPQVVTNKIVSGLVHDSGTHMLDAHGQLQGQVVMVYYDTGNYERIQHVQVVEVCRPVVNRLTGNIGAALRPDGRGYDVTGLVARPTVVDPDDGRGEYLYQHKGKHSYSPKHKYVYPLRPTVDCPWNAEVYWMETDEMEVSWPFELDQYACDWPSDTTVYVRGDIGGDYGRSVYIPYGITGTLMDYQEPDGHARAVTPDGTFTTVAEGYSLLKLTADDDIWFFPIRSLFRSNTNYFTLEPASVRVGAEITLRGGSVSGLAPGFAPNVDPSSSGYIYTTNSGTQWNPDIYKKPGPDSEYTGGDNSDALASASSGDSDTNTYASVIYPVRADGADGKHLEVWWNSTLFQEGMPEPLTVPTLPQISAIRWPYPAETPQIVIASQGGSAAESVFSQNSALYLEDETSTVPLGLRSYFDSSDGGTVMAWIRPLRVTSGEPSSLLTLGADTNSILVLDIRTAADETDIVLTAGTNTLSIPYNPDPCFMDWTHVAITFPGGAVREATVHIDGNTNTWTLPLPFPIPFPTRPFTAAIGAAAGLPARSGGVIGELLFWNKEFTAEEIDAEFLTTHTGAGNHLTACYSFVPGTDLATTNSEDLTVVEKVLGVLRTAHHCVGDPSGPPAWGTGEIEPDAGTTARIYVQNDPAATGYNPNEEHAILTSTGSKRIAWAFRSDLNTTNSSAPGVLVEYVKNGRKAMQWFDVSVTNLLYTSLSGDATAGNTFPGPHPIDYLDDPWCPKDTWDEPATNAPAFRDRKGQLWARCAGTASMRMYYRNQEGFAYPSIADTNKWPAVNEQIPWLSLLDGDPTANPLDAEPALWTWNVAWPENVPEMSIGMTLTTATEGLPEVWNARSVAAVWPGTSAERKAAFRLFDPTVAQTTGFSDDYTVSGLVSKFGIKSGAGGHATLRKGKWYFDDLPPHLSSRFYLDTTAPVTACLKLVGEKEDGTGGVNLLHVNVLSDDERNTLSHLVDDTAESTDAKTLWKDAISKLATNPVLPSELHSDTSEAVIDYIPRDHYALFSMGATNYVTLIENDSTNELMNVADGDPISMHIFKVVPKYYTGRIVTREDPYNLLSQQLSVIYSESFAGGADLYEFEWRKARPSPDGTVPTAFDDHSIYTLKFDPTNGLVRFVIGAQGDTLPNMVNTYYTMRYHTTNPACPAYAVMGTNWSDWVSPPALAEGWVQRVLNNVTPFYQRMRDLYDNPAETAVSMIVQAGAPYEGDVALNQDNLTSVGLIQLYETLLSKAESMSLLLGIDDIDANKQLQLAVGRLADMYGVLGDEAWTDALNPTISFGANFNTTEITGFELDYGALSSSLFAFDNQVPTLLDEELALLRGRTGENAPVLTLSPYYNRLVWNFTRGITAGEVAYAVNYDISGNRSATIDAEQAALQYPQGHGDAYGHYLSALSGYYRLLRNPYFSWGKPAMGELVVADSVVNADEYDEARFASVAYDVAKVAAETVDRTARKAWRDNGGATGAGYLDISTNRNFGYGEWAARGGYGALCNWAVANSLLSAAPDAGHYYRFAFTNRFSSVSAKIPSSISPVLGSNTCWTVEAQLVPAAGETTAVDPKTLETDGYAVPVRFRGEHALFELRVGASNALSLAVQALKGEDTYRQTAYYLYTNSVQGADFDPKEDYSEIAWISDDGLLSMEIGFLGTNAPSTFPGGWEFTDLMTPPDFSVCNWYNAAVDDDGNVDPYIYETPISTAVADGDPAITGIATLSPGENHLFALVADPPYLTVHLLDQAGAAVARTRAHLPANGNYPDAITAATLGNGFLGEVGELRVWEGTARTEQDLLAKREFVNPLAVGLSLYLRTISTHPTFAFNDETAANLAWNVERGGWLHQTQSGMSIAFEDEGLKRIDRATIPALTALSSLVPQIQKKLDQLDIGLNPLGLSIGALPFDLSPINDGDDTRTHYEQIRERAGTALKNARRILERAQEAGNRLRLIQEAQTHREDLLSSTEQDFKNRLIEYFGYPYEGDIGPGGTYPQGYDGPDLVHYAWMDLQDFGIPVVQDKVTYVTYLYKGGNSTGYNESIDNVVATNTFTFVLSANGFVLKPDNITGKRRANGRIQDALSEFLLAYNAYNSAYSAYTVAEDNLKYQSKYAKANLAFQNIMAAVQNTLKVVESSKAIKDSALKVTLNSLEIGLKLNELPYKTVTDAIPTIAGTGVTINIDPSAIAKAAVLPGKTVSELSAYLGILAAKNAIDGTSWMEKLPEIVTQGISSAWDLANAYDAAYSRILGAVGAQFSAVVQLASAWREVNLAQTHVESVIAEAERILDERQLVRQQASDVLTKMRYNEMFFRLDRNDALSHYLSAFELAQKYVWFAARAYDYETGLMSSDPASGERFLNRIIGTRTLGEFDADGEPIPLSDGIKGDGGLASILAELDANWLVLKPRLGINNPQNYATWFSLRKEHFRISGDSDGDDNWRTELRKHWVDDLRTVPEFQRYCQPLAGSTAEAEPGLVIPFSSAIAFGLNFFGNQLVGGDSALDPTYYATHIAAAGVRMVGYDDTVLSKTPSAYLVPVGDDCFRFVGDPDNIISWRVVDQVIPAPYQIGSTQLDDPDWIALTSGYTGTADPGTKIRKHPSFRASYGDTNSVPTDDDLDCTRLVGRSAWNTKWLLIIPAGSLGSDRENALSNLIDGSDPDRDGTTDSPGLSDLLLGLKTYSHSGN